MMYQIDGQGMQQTGYFEAEHLGGFTHHLSKNELCEKNHVERINNDFYKLNDINGMDFRLSYGTQFHIMQSAEDADKVIAAFEEAIRKGYHPESVEQSIYQQLGVNPADFTWYDKDRISRKVNEIWASHEMGDQEYYA